jgi:hypothetical protein
MNDQRLVICVSNDGYAASVETRKVYRVLEDADAAVHGMLRIVDESGEDYLYPVSMFVPVELPEATRKVLNLAA